MFLKDISALPIKNVSSSISTSIFICFLSFEVGTEMWAHSQILLTQTITYV
jgi:hypothetical protein